MVAVTATAAAGYPLELYNLILLILHCVDCYLQRQIQNSTVLDVC